MRRIGRVLILLILGLAASAQVELRARGASPVSAPSRSTAGEVQLGALLQADASAAESHRELFEWINFLIMVAAGIYFLRRPFSDFFADRTDAIHRDLAEGRKALAASELKLKEIEARLANIEQELSAFRAQSEREMQAERERLKQSAEHEGERIAAFARVQIEGAARIARLDLKRYAAGQAVALAEAQIRRRLDEPGQRAIVDHFVADLKKSQMQN